MPLSLSVAGEDGGGVLFEHGADDHSEDDISIFSGMLLVWGYPPPFLVLNGTWLMLVLYALTTTIGRRSCRIHYAR